jgi:hypothetical protein
MTTTHWQDAVVRQLEIIGEDKGLEGKQCLSVVPILRRDAGLPEYFLHQTGTDVTRVGIRNTDFLAPFDHELMFPA